MKRPDLMGVPFLVTSMTSTTPRDVDTSRRRPAFVASSSYLRTPVPESTTTSTLSPLIARESLSLITATLTARRHSMPTFRITYRQASREPEEITAELYVDQPPWITFRVANAQGDDENNLRIRAGDVERIEKIAD
jgi:hypothetical protein